MTSRSERCRYAATLQLLDGAAGAAQLAALEAAAERAGMPLSRWLRDAALRAADAAALIREPMVGTERAHHANAVKRARLSRT